MHTEIKITLDEKGQVLVTAPFDNKIICYGLLEVAKDVVRDFKPSPIIKPTGNVKNLVN